MQWRIINNRRYAINITSLLSLSFSGSKSFSSNYSGLFVYLIFLWGLLFILYLFLIHRISNRLIFIGFSHNRSMYRWLANSCSCFYFVSLLLLPIFPPPPLVLPPPNLTVSPLFFFCTSFHPSSLSIFTFPPPPFSFFKLMLH